MTLTLAPRQRRRLEILTNSRIKTFRRCKRLHFLRYILGIRTLSTDEDLALGTLIHLLLERWWSVLAERGVADSLATYALFHEPALAGIDPFLAQMACAMMEAYHARWATESADRFDVLGIEEEVYAPLTNPVSGQPSRSWIQGMKLDVRVRERSSGWMWIIEHKSSSEDITPGSEFWRRLRMDGQPSTYTAGSRAFGHDIAGVIYDVLAKPAVRPSKATPEAERKYTKAKIDKATGDVIEPSRLYANQREADETPGEYFARCQEWLRERAGGACVRQEVPRLEAELAEHAADLWAEAKIIRDCEISGRWPRNGDACRMYGKLCDMFDACSGVVALDDPQRFRIAETIHEELHSQPPDQPVAAESSHPTGGSE